MRYRDLLEKRTTQTRNPHPTVKSLKLCRYLCRLITPPGGTVLDPFAGSGTTGIAALQEEFSFLGIEREKEYVQIARARLAHACGEVPAAAMITGSTVRFREPGSPM